MIHEPECDYAGVMTIGMPCRQCAAIRIAYQRGREDAAKAVEKLRIESFGIMFDGKFYESVLDTRKAIRAARGDGAE